MKDLIAKAKSADYKQLAIDHGEKLVAGLLGLMLLLALLTTSWSTYGKTPEELTIKVDGAKQAIARGTWADSEDAKSGIYSVAAGLDQDQVYQLLTRDPELRSERVDEELLKYVYSTPLFESAYGSSEPARQPESLPVEWLIATPSRALISIAAVSTDMLANGESEPAEAGPSRRTLKSNSGGLSGSGSPMPGGFPGAGGAGASANFGGSPMGADSPMGMGMSMGMSMGSETGSGGTEAKAVRLVAVRGIVPLYRQIERIKEALHLKTHREATALVDYWDFHLERRSKPLGTKQAWSEYELVDIGTAEEMLRDSAGWDPELIELSLTDPVLTMSLPTRVLYNWMKEEVSHPKVDNYVLPPSLRERQMEIYEKFIEGQIEAAGYVRDREKKGLSSLQSGNRNFSSGMGQMGMQSGPAQDLLGRIAEGMDQDHPEKMKQEIAAQIVRSQTAAGRLLLFRYLDFDVKPGTTYQYRVQLVLANPNFGAPQQSVINPEITEERFLTTPFSQPTAEVVVPNDVNFYVTKVDNAKGSSPPSATFDVYQWSTKYGTTINKQLKILFGSFVGSRTKTDVVDPAGGQFLEDHEVDFKSEDVLLDIFAAPNPIDVNEHPDLKALPRDKLRNGLGVSEQALLINAAGELVAFDPVSMFRSYRVTKEKYQLEREDLESIRENGAGAGEDGMGLSKYDGYGANGSRGAQKGRKRKSGGNSLRRQGRRSSPMPGG